MKSPIKLPNTKVTISRTGMLITGKLSVEEWRDLEPIINIYNQLKP